MLGTWERERLLAGGGWETAALGRYLGAGLRMGRIMLWGGGPSRHSEPNGWNRRWESKGHHGSLYRWREKAVEKDWAEGRRADQSGFQCGVEHFLLYLIDCKEPVTIWGPKKALKDLLSLFRTPVCAHALSSTGTASLPIAPTSLGPIQLILQETAHYHSVHASIMGHIHTVGTVYLCSHRTQQCLVTSVRSVSGSE